MIKYINVLNNKLKYLKIMLVKVNIFFIYRWVVFLFSYFFLSKIFDESQI